MKTGAKIFLGILGAAGLGFAGWGFYKNMTAKKEEGKKDDTLPPAGGSSNTPTPPINNNPATVPPRAGTGFDPAPQPKYTSFKIGDRVFARNPGGAIAYTTSTPHTTSIYKTYPAGHFIGTFLKNEANGIVSLAVEEEGTFTTTAKTVYVPNSKIYA